MAKKTVSTIPTGIQRPPVVALLGHVDHGKTTLLDAIRKTQVQLGEEGGITQHISWSLVNHKGKDITFIDTPGHKSFSIMREVGGKIADIALLIVAADDGVQQQTVEAIDILKASGCEMIVVITKIDTEGAKPDKVRQQLSEHEILVEGWGGKVPVLEVSAKEGKGIEELLETITLVADLKELKQDDSEYGLGVVLDSWVDESLGKCIDVIVVKGQFNRKDAICTEVGVNTVGLMFNEQKKMQNTVTEGYGVRITGLKDIHETTSLVFCANSEKEIEAAKKYYENYVFRGCEVTCDIDATQKKTETLEDLFGEDTRIKLNLVLKADTQGVLDAVVREIKNLAEENSEICINIIQSGIGAVSLNDVEMAFSSKGSDVLAFNTKVDKLAVHKAKELGVEIKTYTLIYSLLDDLKKMVDTALKPEQSKEKTGVVKIKQVFTLSNKSIVAGGTVTEGKITRGSVCDIVRGGEVIFTTSVKSIRMYKDIVDSVSKGSECGIVFADNLDVQEGDEVVCVKVTKTVK